MLSMAFDGSLRLWDCEADGGVAHCAMVDDKWSNVVLFHPCLRRCAATTTGPSPSLAVSIGEEVGQWQRCALLSSWLMGRLSSNTWY